MFFGQEEAAGSAVRGLNGEELVCNISNNQLQSKPPSGAACTFSDPGKPVVWGRCSFGGKVRRGCVDFGSSGISWGGWDMGVDRWQSSQWTFNNAKLSKIWQYPAKSGNFQHNLVQSSTIEQNSAKSCKIRQNVEIS